MKTSKHRSVTLPLILVLVLSARLGAQEQYTSFELGPLTTPMGELDQIRAVEMNNRGQVVGYTLGPVTAAFRFTPGVGMEDLGLAGQYPGAAVLINDAGQTFGSYGPFQAQGEVLRRLFRYSDEGGLDLLEKGLKNELRRRFVMLDVNEAGDIVGYHWRNGRRIPYVYSDRAGWVNLMVRDFRNNVETEAVRINDRGDIAFLRVLDTIRPGGQPDTVRRSSVASEDRLVHLGLDMRHSAWRFVRPGWLGEAGHVVGVVLPEPRPFRALLYTPGQGLVNIHPRGFRASFAEWVNSEGVVTGMLFRDRAYDTLFTYDARRRVPVRIEADLEDFQRLNGKPFRRIFLFDVNDRLDVLGVIRSEPDVYFLYRRGQGLVRVQDLVAASGSDDLVVRALRVNDRGEMLLLVRPPDSPDREIFMTEQPSYTRMMVLSPVAGDE